MASSGDQKKFATEVGYEETVVSNYIRLKEIIISNTNVPFKDVISQIGKITASTYYGYISKVPAKRGRVSLFVVKNLSKYFNIPVEIFTGKISMNIDYEQIISSKIKKDFIVGKADLNDKEDLLLNQTDTTDLIKKEVLNLLKLDDIALLEKNFQTFSLYAQILSNRINDLKKIEEL